MANGKTNKVESGSVINKSPELPATGEKSSNTLFAGISLIFASLITMFELIFDRKKN